MATPSNQKLVLVKELYYNQEKSVAEVAHSLGVSAEAVIYFMRKHGLVRRSAREANLVLFKRKAPSFTKRFSLSPHDHHLALSGAMLYWAEGYKSEKSNGLDFANSDPVMIKIFLNFLRSRYSLDEKRFRILLYCYPDQDVKKLIKFWSKLTQIPRSQFSKPYVRDNASIKRGGRQMLHGLIHVRYHDKKLWRAVMDLISHYQQKLSV